MWNKASGCCNAFLAKTMTLFQPEMASLLLDGLCIVTCLLFRAEYKPRGYYLEHFWQADLGYIGQATIGVKVTNSSHVACICKEEK